MLVDKGKVRKHLLNVRVYLNCVIYKSYSTTKEVEFTPRSTVCG